MCPDVVRRGYGMLQAYLAKQVEVSYTLHYCSYLVYMLNTDYCTYYLHTVDADWWSPCCCYSRERRDHGNAFQVQYHVNPSTFSHIVC